MTNGRGISGVTGISKWVGVAVLLAAAVVLPPRAAQAQIAEPPPAAPVIDEQVGNEMTLEIERFGVGGVCRPGDWVGVRVIVNDSAAKPREVVLRLGIADNDGDTPQAQREIAANPGVRQGVWLYTYLPPGFRPGDSLTLTAYESSGGSETGTTGLMRPGRVLARSRISAQQVVAPTTGLGLVIGPRAFNLVRLGLKGNSSDDASPSGHERFVVQTGLTPGDLPDRWQGLNGFDVIVWGGGDPSELRAERAAALREWVRRGGHLVIVLPAVGENWTNRAANELHDVLPLVSVHRREGVDLDPYRPILSDRAAPGFPKDAVVHEFTPQPDAAPGEAERVINGPNGACVVARRLLGAGAVTLVGLDLNHRSLTETERLDPAVFWNRVLGRRGAAPTATELQQMETKGQLPMRSASRFDGDIAAQISKSRRASAGVLLGFVVFAVYWLAAGPLGYAILKAKGLVRHAWLAYLLAAALFTVLAWGGANLIKPKRVEGTHLTILDHVYGQPTERARVWMSLLTPWYGSATVAVGDAALAGSSGVSQQSDLIAPWQPPPEDLGISGVFPDVRDYPLDTRAPRTVNFPTRSTVKQLQIDWAGGPPWKMPVPVAGADQSSPRAPTLVSAAPSPGSSMVSGVISHDLPGALSDVQIIVVPPQRAFGAGPISTRMIANARAFSLRDPWAPATPLDLGEVTQIRAGADTTLESALRSAMGRHANLVTQFQNQNPRRGRAASAPERRETAGAIDRLIHVGLISQFEPPGPAAGTGLDTAPWATRQHAHGLDLMRWFSQPCLIIIGVVGNDETPRPCPVPVTVDGELIATSGVTIVRWVYPFPSTPPAYEAAVQESGPTTETPADRR